MSAIDFVKRPTTLGKSSLIVLVVVVLLTVLSFVGYSLLQKSVTVLVDGQVKEIKTFTNTVGEVLKEAQINLAREDVVKPGVKTSLEEGMKISIEKAVIVKVVVDGQVKEVRAPKTTIGEILQRQGVKLGQLDKVSPALTEKTSPGTEIKVIRVVEKLQKFDSQVPFPVERQKDNKITRGIKKLLQQGQPGVRQKVIKITYENGKPVKKEVVSDQVVKKALPQIVAVGTLKVVSRGGSSFSSSRSMVVTSTAYTHTGNRTATGRKTTRGIVAVDPDVIPLGTRMYVEGYGDAVAADIGSAIKGNKIDVFMETETEAIQWGRRRVTVYIKE
ncbi:MAG: ubiquitin-like domain-containing protein [Clostridia bacterium]|nr:ubiquitin-like domain-containing protein [Clostridia bacterium]